MAANTCSEAACRTELHVLAAGAAGPEASARPPWLPPWFAAPKHADFARWRVRPRHPLAVPWGAPHLFPHHARPLG